MADTVVVKPVKEPGYFKKIFVGARSLMKGMGVTISYFVNPKKIVTQQYPENRETLKMTPAFRGRVDMPHDENGEHTCTGCTLCEKACPNGSISVLNTKSIAGKPILGKYIYRWDQCTLCGNCVEACPFDAIRMAQDFEGSTTEKAELELILNKKEGRT